MKEQIISVKFLQLLLPSLFLACRLQGLGRLIPLCRVTLPLPLVPMRVLHRATGIFLGKLLAHVCKSSTCRCVPQHLKGCGHKYANNILLLLYYFLFKVSFKTTCPAFYLTCTKIGLQSVVLWECKKQGM